MHNWEYLSIFVVDIDNIKILYMNKCCRCNSINIIYNDELKVWFCNDCHAIIDEYNQIGIDEDSPNTNIPLESSSDNNSKDES